MLQPVYAVGRSLRLVKLLASNSTASVFGQAAQVREKPPGNLTDTGAESVGSLESDVKKAGEGGVECATAILLQPYAMGPAGTVFYLNVFGYVEAGAENNSQAIVWVPFFICQLYCATGNLPGLSATSYLSDGENLCDTLWVTMGSAAPYAMGYDLAAFVQVPLFGAKRFYVEFAGDPNGTTGVNPVPGMNAFWREI